MLGIPTRQLTIVLSRNIANIKSARSSLVSYNKRFTNILQVRELKLISALSKFNKKHYQDEEDSDESDSEFKDERDSKVIKTKVQSLRADLLVRAGLGISRNKIEVMFYESKIRVNGKKIQKKSAQLNVDDEIDVIKGFSQLNPSHLIVGRVIVLDFKDIEEGLSVTLRRYKSLLIENYSGLDAFKSSRAD